MAQTASLPYLTGIDLESLTADVVNLAMKAGASDAEAVAREGDEFSVNVRMGEVETLKESGSRGVSGATLGFRFDQRPDSRGNPDAGRRGPCPGEGDRGRRFHRIARRQ